jgi:hypothetical protein
VYRYYIFFIILSALDYLFTRQIGSQCRLEEFGEQNYVALLVWKVTGVTGLLGFKSTFVASVLALTRFIQSLSNDHAKFVLTFACGAVGATVLYSLLILGLFAYWSR